MFGLARRLLNPLGVDGGGGGGGESLGGGTTAPSSSPAPSQSSFQPASQGPAMSGTQRDFSAGSPVSPPPAGQQTQPVTTPAQGSPIEGQGQGQGTPAQQQQQWASIREALQQRGLTGNWENDNQAFDHLVQLAQRGTQNDYYASLGQAVAPHYDKIQGLIGGGQQTQQAPVTGPGPYSVPGFDRRVLSYLQEDPNGTGRLVPKPGVIIDPNQVARANEWLGAVSDWQEKWSTDPRAAFQDMFGDAIREMVAQHHQQFTAQQSDQSFAQEVQQKHGGWIFARDAAGRQVKDFATGRPALTPEGTKLLQYVQQARQAGVRDDRASFQLAMGQLQRDIALARLQQFTGNQQQGQQQGQAALPFQQPQQSLQAQQRPMGGAGGAGNWSPSRTDVNPPPGAPPSASQGISIEEMMRQGFQEAGITDAQIRQEMTRMF